MSASRQFNTPIDLKSAALAATHNSNTIANLFTTGGNVGIGTSSPSTQLHLRDTGSVTLLIEADSDDINENDVATLQLKQDGGAIGMNIGINSSNDSYIDFNAGTNTSTSREFTIRDNNTTRLEIDTNGDIGIGTTSPHAKLTIITTGSLSLTSDGFDTGKIMFGSVVSGAYNTNHRYYIQRGGTTGNMNHLIIHTPNEASNGGVNFMTTNQVSRLFINSSSGNVGIGTTAPAYTLDVIGTIDATFYTGSNISISGSITSSTLRVTGNADLSTGLTTVTDLTGTNITSGTIRASTLISTSNLSTNNLTSTNLLATASTITNLSIPGTLTVVNITSTNLVETNITAGGIVVTGGSLRATFNSNTIGNIFTTGGNVGINTTSPVGTLDVRDSTNFVGDDAGALYITGGTNGNRRLHMGYHNTNNYGWIEVVEKSVDLRGLSLQPRGGNVGIGTTAPGTPLEVRTGSSTYGIRHSDGTIKLDTYIGGSINGAYFGTVSQHPLGFMTNDSPAQMIIQTNGNVGIGTTTPGEALDVRGNLRVGNSTQGNYIAFYGTNSDGPGAWDHTFIGERRYAGTENSELLLFKGNDMGGSSGPDRIRLLAAEHRFDTYTSGLYGTFEGVGTTGGINRMIIATTGNIGIGNATPAYTLDVNGTIDATSYTGTNLGVTNISSGTLRASDSLYSPKGITMDYNATIGTLANTNNKMIEIAFANSNDQVRFFTPGSNSANCHLTLQHNGNVGIGTTSPTVRLDVNGTVDATTYTGSNVSVTNISVGTLRTTTLITTANLAANNITVGNFRATSISMGTNIISFGTGTNIGLNWGSGFSRIYDDGQLRLYTDDHMYFNIGGNDRLYINNNGVGVYSNSIVSLLCVNGDAGGNGALQVVSVSSSVNSGKSQDGASFKAWNDGNNILQFYNSAGGYRGGVNGSGSGAVTYATSSDRRLKENVINITNATQMIKQMRPVEFTWKSDNRQDFGFIAQEVFELLPSLRPNFTNYSHCECTPEELSHGILCNCEEHDHDEPIDKDGKPLYYGLDYGKFTPYLTKALQETISELEASQQTIQNQESIITQLQSQLAAQQQQINDILTRLG